MLSSYSYLVDTWADLQSATSTASFVQNLSATHVSHNDHTANYSCGHIEQAILNLLLLKLCNHGESLNNFCIVESVKITIINDRWSPNLCRLFLSACEFSKMF